MSTLVANQIVSPTGNVILDQSGSIIQAVVVRTDTQTTYTAPLNSTGVSIAALPISITPKQSTSLLIISFHLMYEVDETTVFRILRDGSVMTASGYESYNPGIGQAIYNGLQAANYDSANNNTTTPSHTKLMMYDSASGGARTYTASVGGSNTATNTFYLNRSGSNPGTNGNEVGVSFAKILEVAQ